MYRESDNENIVICGYNKKLLDISKLIPQTIFYEDRALQNWTKWLRVRNIQNKYLANQTSRPPKCLIMNSDNTYALKREKWILEESANYKPPDSYRGDLQFWNIPKFGYDNYDRNEKVAIPHKEYFGVPDVILNEKGILYGCCGQTNLNKWNSSSVVKDKKEEITENLKIIDHYNSDIKELIIKGVGNSTLISQKRKIPDIIIEQVNIDYNEDVLHILENHPPVLKFDDYILSPNKNVFNVNLDNSQDFVYNINFSKCEIGSTVTKVLRLENLGSYCIKYGWRKNQKFSNNDLPLKLWNNLGPQIFFNANSGAILQGQILNLQFWYKCKFIGLTNEIWEFRTTPKLFEKKILVILRGFGSEPVNKILKPWSYIDKYLDKQIAKTYAREVLNKISIKTDTVREEIIPYDKLFLEQDKFTYNNPNLFYNPDLVEQLRDMYTSLTEKEWCMNLNEIQNAILESTLSLESKEQLLTKFIEIIQKLEIQPYFYNAVDQKYAAVYTILCSFANQIDYEALKLQKVMNVTNESKYTAIEQQYAALPEPVKFKFFNIETDKINKAEAKDVKNVAINEKSKVSGKNKIINNDNSRSFIKLVLNQKPKGVKSTVDLTNPYKKEYYDLLYVKIYNLLGSAIDHISGSLDAINYIKSKN